MPLFSSRRGLVGLAVVALSLVPLTRASGQTAAKPSAAKAAGPKRAPVVNHSSILQLIGLTGQHKTLTGADLAKLPHVEATVTSHNVTGTYRGVPLGALLELVGRPAGEALRGKALTDVVSVEAADGYRIVFALAEVDTGYTNKVIFLADSKNGAAMDASEGPFRMIVADEKRPARWAKQVIRLRIVEIK